MSERPGGCRVERSLSKRAASGPPLPEAKQETLVSVCIANWNCRDLLRDCLRSLTEHPQGVPLEVIVVDNASQDGAPAMVARDFPHVRLIRNETNAGFSRANNQAAQVARGRFLFFLNNDTVVPPRTVIKLVNYLEEHPEAALVGPCLRNAQGEIQTSFRRQPTIAVFMHRTLWLRYTYLFRRKYRTYRRDPKASAGFARAVEVLMGAALMVRRDEFMAMGAWDEDFTFGGEDLELCQRARRHGQVVYLPEAEVIHLGRASTRQNVAYASASIAGGFAIFLRKTGASRAALLGYKLAVTLDLPLQILVKSGQYLARRLQGRRADAERSLAAARTAGAFLFKGMGRFWQA